MRSYDQRIIYLNGQDTGLKAGSIDEAGRTLHRVLARRGRYTLKVETVRAWARPTSSRGYEFEEKRP